MPRAPETGRVHLSCPPLSGCGLRVSAFSAVSWNTDSARDGWRKHVEQGLRASAGGHTLGLLASPRVSSEAPTRPPEQCVAGGGGRPASASQPSAWGVGWGRKQPCSRVCQVPVPRPQRSRTDRFSVPGLPCSFWKTDRVKMRLSLAGGVDKMEACSAPPQLLTGRAGSLTWRARGCPRARARAPSRASGRS